MSEEQRTSPAPQYSWDDEIPNSGRTKGPARKFERLSFKQGVTYRVLLLEDKVTHVKQHFKKGFGHVRCLESVGQSCAACASGDMPSEKFAVNALVYDPSVTGPAAVNATTVKVLAWLFGKKVKEKISSIRKEWGSPTGYDLSVTCTNETFQHLEIVQMKDAWARISPDAERIAALVFTDSFDLQHILGRLFSQEQVTGIWSDKLTRDDIFKKKDDQPASAKGPVSSFTMSAPSATSTTAASPTPVPRNFNFEALLGGNK